MAENATKRPDRGSRYSGLDAEQRTHQRRQALLEAALELFANQGYPATSVKQICRRSSLTERYFYESFRDRHACLVQLYDELAEQMHTRTTAAIEAEVNTDVDQVTRRALSAFIDYLAADPRRARVVLLEVVGTSEELEERRHAVLRRFSELTVSVWMARLEQTVPTSRQRLATVGLVGAVNHLLVDWLHRGQHETREELVEVCSRMFSAVRGEL